MPSVFRQKSLDSAASPDKLDEYIQVSNPGVWMVLAAIVLLLAGGAIWACFASLTDEEPAVLAVADGQAVFYIDQSRAADLDAGDAVEASGAQGSVSAVSNEIVPYDQLPDAVRLTLDPGSGWFRSATTSIDLSNGVYEATVTTKTYSPLGLLFGQE